MHSDVLQPGHKVRLDHSLSEEKDAVLALASDEERLFVGQGNDILIYSITTLTLRTRLSGHLGSVLAILRSGGIADELLCSCSSDNTIRLWDLTTAKCLYTITSPYDVGDILALTWSEKWYRLYFGCQDTSIGWTSLDQDHLAANARTVKVNKRPDRFFAASVYPLQDAQESLGIEVSREDCLKHSHEGYVYCLLVTKFDDSVELLFSGGGDGAIKLWSSVKTGLHPFRILRHPGVHGILSMSFHGIQTLLVGLQGGTIQIYDLETMQMIRHNTDADPSDALVLVSGSDGFFSAHASGIIVKWSNRFTVIDRWTAHQAPILAAKVIEHSDGENRPRWLVTGGGRQDAVCNFWLDRSPSCALPTISESLSESQISTETGLRNILSTFVSYQSVSGLMNTREDCRQCAIFLKALFTSLGGVVRIVAGKTGRNALVLAKFLGLRLTDPVQRRKHVLFYGHYDVIDATGDWTMPPYDLTGKDGYIYGRGVSDNKGPILAALAALIRLRDQGASNFDMTFVIEGEEESGSVGLSEAVAACHAWIGEVDVILVSNSYWKNDTDPCLTYGLRGLIKASILVTSPHLDLHSGVDGSSLTPEALSDLLITIARLKDENGLLRIKGFYDKISAITDQERALYAPLVRNKSDDETEDTALLMAKWRYPSFTIHKIDVSGPGTSTIIPQWARATVSLRLVPNQEIDLVKQAFIEAVKEAFDGVRSNNALQTQIDYSAEWWLGNPSNAYYKAAADAVEVVWGRKPLFIREGGTIPAMRLLEREFSAPCVHIPLGQRSDNAHLPDERMSLKNLSKGIEVLQYFLQDATKFTGEAKAEPA